jgi:ATP-dependent RNA helicase DDX46/PRP5
LYIEVPELKKLTKEEVKDYRFLHLDKLKIRGKTNGKENIEDVCPKPIKGFTQCGLSDKMESMMKKYGYVTPTPIQAQAIPAVMSGFDVIGIAKTGSGKTLAFVLPMLRHILDQPPRKQGDGPIALVLAPTRELAMQIHAEIKKFKKATKLTGVCVYGGAHVQSQIGAIKRGADILVCTPGRLIDILCLNKGKLLSLERVTFLVLDEADRMFDMGFEKQISHVIQNVRPDRQTVMFSATFPSIVQKAAQQFLHDPIEITIRGGSFVPTTIDQKVVLFENESDKYPKLMELIADFYQKGSILIFVDTQTKVDLLFTQLIKSGYDAASYHAGLPQFDRESSMDSFKKGEKKNFNSYKSCF